MLAASPMQGRWAAEGSRRGRFGAVTGRRLGGPGGPSGGDDGGGSLRLLLARHAPPSSPLGIVYCLFDLREILFSNAFIKCP